MEKIPEKTFVYMENLTYLHLDWNNITSISKYTFEGLSNLKYLYMMKNLLTKIEEGNFNKDRVGSLDREKKYTIFICTYHNFAISILDSFLGSMNHFMGLESFSLSQNFLKDISFLNSMKLTTLIELNLSQNKISQLRKEYFQYLHGLSVLNLEDNLLQEVILKPSLFR